MAERLTRSLIGCLRPGHSIATAVERWRQIDDVPSKYVAILEGHSIGIDVVEPPWISPSEPFCLKEGMVFCVEPSIQFDEGQTLKVEESILIKSDGNVVLSAF